MKDLSKLTGSGTHSQVVVFVVVCCGELVFVLWEQRVLGEEERS